MELASRTDCSYFLLGTPPEHPKLLTPWPSEKLNIKCCPRPKAPDGKVTDQGSNSDISPVSRLRAIHKTFLGFSFHLCKMGIMKATQMLAQWLER